MFGITMGVGETSRLLSKGAVEQLWPSNSNFSVLNTGSGISVAIYAPSQANLSDFTAYSSDKNIYLGLCGYIIADTPVSGLKANLNHLANEIQKNGMPPGLPNIAGGSFSLAVIDLNLKIGRLYSDPAGSMPLYYCTTSGGWLLSSNPLSLINSGAIESTIDPVACAEWALFSHTIGDRYPVKSIKTLRIGDYFEWDGDEGHIKSYDRLWDKIPESASPDPNEIAEEFSAACNRIRQIDDNPAQLQSAGMDSRLITASWPDDKVLTCYSYGNPNSHEVEIAKRLASIRGNGWHHTWQHGDEVASHLDSMFNNTGIILWPDRYFVARQMAENGHKGVLDGFAGDSVLGGSDYVHNLYLGKNTRRYRLFCRFQDNDLDDYSLDQIAETLYKTHLQIEPDSLSECIDKDYIQSVKDLRDDIIEDIRGELEYLMPPNRSLGVLWRNFIYANRAPHLTIQQGQMCNAYVMVYYPFSNDTRFHDMAFRLNPADIAFRKFYRKLYRTCYPKFAEVPYGGTLLPIKRPGWNHKLAAIMASRGKSIPWLTSPTNGLPRDPNGWAIWLKESEVIRDFAASALSEGGIIDQSAYSSYMDDIRTGRKQGGGKLFHMASIAKWHALDGAHKKTSSRNSV